MLANITTPLLGVVATAAIGRLGDSAILGGVAMAALVFDCIFWLFGFLRMGTVALTAQAYGAGDATERTAVLARALMTSAAIGLALIALQVPLAALIFGSMGGSDTVRGAAEHYFFIRLWSSPFALGNYVMLGWLVGLARPMLALSIQIAINVISMALTVALVLVFDCGISGAALAAVIAEAAGLIIGLTMAWRLLGGRFDFGETSVFDRGRLMRMMAINRDIMIRTAAMIAVYLFFSAQGARAGDVTLAANAVLHNFTLVGAFFLDGLANAAEQLCGRAYGARDGVAFGRAVRLIVIWGFVFGAGASALFALFGSPFIDLMTASADVRLVAHQYMWLAALMPVCGVMAFVFDGIYIGATWVRDMRNLMIVSLAIYLAVWWATLPLGNAGLWLAMLSFFIARGALQAARYPALARGPFT
ncbi:MAG: MATE family efflux transporter [Pseudolabrys sp.]|nr:MATE family efflux transporter [Pseudolabrys sp.]MDP2297590.1 MATE family efflux transporter [Pseudolabrys sp.]